MVVLHDTEVATNTEVANECNMQANCSLWCLLHHATLCN